jgi:hypothetical protein
MANGCVEVDGTAALAYSIREIVRELIVTTEKVKGAVPFDGVFGLLLRAERGGADLAGVGGIEAFDEAAGEDALGVGGLKGREVLGEADIGS